MCGCIMQAYICVVHTTSSAVGTHLQETLGRVFGQFARLIARRQASDPQAMSRTDYTLLAALEHCPDEAGMRVSTLAATQGNDVSTVSRRVTHLEEHRLLDRLPDPTDGRASTVRLTATGRSALDDERTSRTGLLRSILTDWPEQDLADLDRLLTRLSADMAAEAEAAGRPPSPLPPATERTTA